MKKIIGCLETMLIFILITVLMFKFSSRSRAEELPEILITVPEYQEIFDEMQREYGISSCMLEAIAYKESNLKPDANNDDKYFGIMQVSKQVWDERADRLGLKDIYDVRDNIVCATDYINELATRFGENGAMADVSLVLDIYSGHSDAFEMYNNGKMSKYAESVLELTRLMEIYREE